MAAADAQTFWMSASIPNDQFALYVFAGVPDDLAGVIADLAARASTCADLGLRIDDDRVLRYPAWVSGPVTADQFVRHDGPMDWTSCLDVLAGLVDHQLDARVATSRLHIFAPVTGAPGADAPVTVAVMQATHSFGDGTRTAEVCGWLFGRPTPVPPVISESRGSLLLRSITAARTHRQLTRAIAAGTLPPPAGAAPGGADQLRSSRAASHPYPGATALGVGSGRAR